MPQTIVVGHDFSPCAAEAARLAIWDLHVPGGTVLLIHATTLIVPPSWEVPVETVSVVRRAHDDAVAARLMAIVMRLRSDAQSREWPVEVVGELANQPAAEALIHRAATSAARGIVVGAHGKSAGNRLYLGSVAARLLRESRVPVLVVKPTE